MYPIETFNRLTSRLARNYRARRFHSLYRSLFARTGRVLIFLGDEDADWSVGVVVEAIQSIRRSRRDDGRHGTVVVRGGPALFFAVTAGAEHESFLKRSSADDRSVPTRRTIRRARHRPGSIRV